MTRLTFHEQIDALHFYEVKRCDTNHRDRGEGFVCYACKEAPQCPYYMEDW